MNAQDKIASCNSSHPRVEIILLNYKGVDDTIALLKNLQNLSYKNFGVIIIDNDSNDGSKEQLEKILDSYPEWRFIFNDVNTGFSKGCNQGMKIALENNADFILLLNNDTEVELDLLDKLVELSKKHNCLAGAAIYHHHDKNKLWSFGGNLTWGAVPGHLNFYGRKINRRELPDNIKTDWIPGCCLLIPVDIIEKIGLLDEDYFAYVEDVDFCFRAGKAGVVSMVTSESAVYHKVGQATGGGYSPQGRRLIAESSVLFIRKHGDSYKRLRFVTLFWIGILVAFIREGLKGNIDAVRLKIDGYRSGWRKKLRNLK